MTLLSFLLSSSCVTLQLVVCVAYVDGMWLAKEQNDLPRAGDIAKWLSSLGLFSN